MNKRVQRYNFSVDKYGQLRGYESEHGQWTKRSDYDILLAERDALLEAQIAQQAEQQPVAHMALNSSGFPEKCLPTDPNGFPVYAAPIAQTAPQPELDERAEFEKAGERLGIEKRHLTTREWWLWQARAIISKAKGAC